MDLLQADLLNIKQENIESAEKPGPHWHVLQRLEVMDINCEASSRRFVIIYVNVRFFNPVYTATFRVSC